MIARSLWLLVCLVSCVYSAASVKYEDCPPCDTSRCKLPNCRCTDPSNTHYPANMKDKPQVVLLTFDDAINKHQYDNYITKIFNDERRNPNGCHIGGTFYVCHEYTNYQIVHDIWRRGIEIALHSITHRTGINFWRDMNQTMAEKEFVGMRSLISHFAHIPEEDIVGMRAPYLQIAGDTTYKMLQDNGLKYDCSIPSPQLLFPYTLDYQMEQSCSLPPCPKKCHPGIWTVPMNELIDLDGNHCSMLDGCPSRPQNKEDMLRLLKDNFYRAYNGDRTPFGIYQHLALLQGFPYIWEAYNEFIDYILTKDDVYILNTAQMLDWMENPVNSEEAKHFAPWKKQCTFQSKNCYTHGPKCVLDHQKEWGTMKMYMELCGECPNIYPWVLNPLGRE